MDRGYTLLWRKVWDNPVLKERGKRFSRLEAWLYLVNVQARGIPSEGLGRGEFRASLRYLAKAWLWSVDSVFRFLRNLEAAEMLRRPDHQTDHQTDHLGEHFIICNYSTYNPTSNNGPITDPNSNPIKVKEGLNTGKNKGKGKASSPAGADLVDSLPSVESFRLSELLRREIQVRDPNARAAKLPEATRWAPDIDKLMRIDGRAAEEVEAVIMWCQKDPFWSANILSGRKLREKFDTLIGQMKRGGKQTRTDWSKFTNDPQYEVSNESGQLAAKGSSSSKL